MPPNVLWLVLDTARADAFEPYGAPTGATPAVAELARRGSVLPHAYATASWTLPSHASMFTGLMPRAVGVGQAPGDGVEGVRPILDSLRPRLLPELLRGAGYRTVGLTTNLWVSKHTGFDIGFDEFEQFVGDRQMAMDVGGLAPRALATWAREGLSASRDDGAEEAGAALRRSIAAHDGDPTLWFVNLVECHSPYLPPKPWNDLGPVARVRAALEAQRYLSFPAICRACGGGLDVPEGALERMRHLYRRSVSLMDAWLADALGALDERGILDDTLVIVTSDHGENIGEHGLMGHAFSLDERLIHVPFVAAGPGAPDTTGPFSLGSLPAAIATAAGLADHPYDAMPEDAAVAQLDRMGPPDHPRIQGYVEEWGVGERGLEIYTTDITVAVDGRSKLTIRGDKESAHDLTGDPLELGAPTAEPAPDHLWRALEHPAITNKPELAAAPGPAAPPNASPEELEELERQMKLLGYM
jgi:arylsulfatase A-like enzyme